MRAVILSPHPDDAVLSLWHLLAGGGDVAVLNVFGGSPEGQAGDAWWDHLTGATDSVARIAERHAEDREALATAGVRPENLGLLDGQYRLEPPPADLVADRIGEAAPAGVLYAPATLDGHRDHVIVRAAALELRARGHNVVLYADVPHATLYGWPSWVTGQAADPYLDPDAHWEHRMRGTGLELGGLRREIHTLAAPERERKLAAVRCYRTQLPALEAAFGVTRPHVLGHEIVWHT